MNIIVSDFDGVLFKRNHGLLRPTIKYLETRNTAIYVVTYRATDQIPFMKEQLAGTKLDIIGFACAGDRKKNPLSKVALVSSLAARFDIIEALDNDEDVVVHYQSMGILTSVVKQ